MREPLCPDTKSAPLCGCLLLVLAAPSFAGNTPGKANSAAKPTSAEPQKASKSPTAPTVSSRPADAKKLVDEDWTTPFITTTHLKPLVTPLVVSTHEGVNYVREMVHVQWRPWDPIYLYVIKPKNVTRPPVALFLYGYPATADRFAQDDYCRQVVQNGCAIVGFESALTGNRYKMRPFKEWFVSELPESLTTSAHDVQLILNYLEARGDLDTKHVGMFGQGSGATVALLAAAADTRINALDLTNPWGDWKRWFENSKVIPPRERETYLKPAFQNKLSSLEPVTWLRKLKTRSLRLVLSEGAAGSPKDTLDAFAKAAPVPCRGCALWQHSSALRQHQYRQSVRLAWKQTGNEAACACASASADKCGRKLTG